MESINFPLRTNYGSYDNNHPAYNTNIKPSNAAAKILKSDEFSKLSPVRWRNKEVNGVYLETTGWVKVAPVCKKGQHCYNNGNQSSSVFEKNMLSNRLNLENYFSVLSPNRGISSEESEYSMSPDSPIISPPLAFQDDVLQESYNKEPSLLKYANHANLEFNNAINLGHVDDCADKSVNCYKSEPLKLDLHTNRSSKSNVYYNSNNTPNIVSNGNNSKLYDNIGTHDMQNGTDCSFYLNKCSLCSAYVKCAYCSSPLSSPNSTPNSPINSFIIPPPSVYYVNSNEKKIGHCKCFYENSHSTSYLPNKISRNFNVRDNRFHRNKKDLSQKDRYCQENNFICDRIEHFNDSLESISTDRSTKQNVAGCTRFKSKLENSALMKVDQYKTECEDFNNRVLNRYNDRNLQETSKKDSCQYNGRPAESNKMYFTDDTMNNCDWYNNDKIDYPIFPSERCRTGCNNGVLNEDKQDMYDHKNEGNYRKSNCRKLEHDINQQPYQNNYNFSFEDYQDVQSSNIRKLANRNSALDECNKEYSCQNKKRPNDLFLNQNLKKDECKKQIERNRMRRYQWFLSETASQPSYYRSGTSRRDNLQRNDSFYRNDNFQGSIATTNQNKNNRYGGINRHGSFEAHTQTYMDNKGKQFGSLPRSLNGSAEYINADLIDQFRNKLAIEDQNDRYSNMSVPISPKYQIINGMIRPPIEEIKKKSSSLPKSFQRDNVFRKEIKRSSSRKQFGWVKNGFIRGLILKKATAIPSLAMSETAPTTPVREMPEKKRCGRLMKLNQYSSTPTLDDNLIQHINFDCDTRYLFKDRTYTNKTKNNRAVVVGANNETSNVHTTCQGNIIPGANLSDRVFQRFCKSFSWRFLKKQSDDDREINGESNTVTNGYERLVDDTHSKKHHKFGPLSWRCSKERKEKLHHSTSVPMEDVENINRDKVLIENNDTSKENCQTTTLVRRTLSDLNGYHDVIKQKTTCVVVPTKYRPPLPVLTKKHRQYELRRTLSLPQLTSCKFSPALCRKTPPAGITHSEDERVLFSEDDMMSDSGSSIPSRKTSLEQGINEDVVIFAEAVWDHIAIECEELPFRAGDVIEVYNALNRDWWWGTCYGKSGWFPSDFVRLRVSQEDSLEDHLNNVINKKCTAVSAYSNDQIRSRIVRELIHTEKDFVKTLKDISEAYISECKRSDDLFSPEQISTIFGNWEQLYALQSSFLKTLEDNINWDLPQNSSVGIAFLRHREDFRIYSDYCNNHPISIATLQQLYQNAAYRTFFEKCRIKAGLIQIPLDGFLLTPVQRICKYPLQLAELLKYTEADHADYENVKLALDTMRDVAILINERKRRMESLEKLILWQQRVQEWEGDNLIEHSSQIVYQNEVSKLATGVFITNATVFLFDHQLVYCKKDILKRNYYIYKGRIILDNSEVINVPDGKDNILGFNVRNGIKIQNAKLHKWLLFCCRTRKEKNEWLDAFNKERTLVSQDEHSGLEISATDRQLAYITAGTCSRRHTFVKHNNKKLKRAVSRNARATRSGSSHLLGRKVGTWFIFGANRKNYRRVARSQHL